MRRLRSSSDSDERGGLEVIRPRRRRTRSSMSSVPPAQATYARFADGADSGCLRVVCHGGRRFPEVLRQSHHRRRSWQRADPRRATEAPTGNVRSATEPFVRDENDPGTAQGPQRTGSGGHGRGLQVHRHRFMLRPAIRVGLGWSIGPSARHHRLRVSPRSPDGRGLCIGVGQDDRCLQGGENPLRRVPRVSLSAAPPSTLTCSTTPTARRLRPT